METINNLFNDAELPEKVFSGNYDGYLLLNYHCVFYDHDGSDKLFFTCLREALVKIGETCFYLYANISADEKHPYLPALPEDPKIPLRPIMIDFGEFDENTWNNADSYNVEDKPFADHYFNMERFPVIFGREDKWAIYSDRVIEITILGFKKDYLPAFASFFSHLKVLGYDTHEEFFKWYIQIIRRGYEDIVVKEFAKNYPLYHYGAKATRRKYGSFTASILNLFGINLKR